jgi:DNA-binding IclR family transcriptional regulator
MGSSEPGVVARLFHLLEAVALESEQDQGHSLAALAASARLAKPTAHRLLNEMVALGYVEKSGPGRYRVGMGLKRLTSPAAAQTALLQAAAPFLVRVWEQTQETINLGVLRQDQIVYVQVWESPQPLRRMVQAGACDPLATTALGRVLVAHLPQVRQDLLVQRAVWERRTPATIPDRESLRLKLAEARQQGFALEREETDIGVMCLAFPLLAGTEAVAAISLSAPTARCTAEASAEWMSALRHAAHHISIELSTNQAAPPPRTRSARSSRSQKAGSNT